MDLLAGATLAATATPTAVGETAGTASQYTFGTFVLWGIAVAFVLSVLYRRLG